MGLWPTVTSWSVVILLGGSPVSVLAQNPSGVNEQLADRGVTITTTYGAVLSNLNGGLRQGDTYSGNLNVQVSLDGHRLFGSSGLTLFVDGLWIHGGQPSAILGDAQGVSNLSAPPNVTLYEAWLQYNFFGNRFSVLAGRYDLNVEFYRVQSAGLFLNSSFGIGPEFSDSGTGGPSTFPCTSLGFRLAFKPRANVIVRLAILDGVPVDRVDGPVAAFKSGDGLLLVSEAALLNRAASDDLTRKLRFRIGRGSGLPPYANKVAVGGWYYTATFDDLNNVDASGAPLKHHGSGGAYIVGDATLVRSKADPRRRLAGFGEAGLGDGRVNRFGAYLGAGLVVAGGLPARPTDEFGVAVAIARNGSGYLDSRQRLGEPATTAETALEVTYLAQIASWLALQPDFQYVIHPSTDPTVRNGRAFQFRCELTF
jgi:porin